MEIMTEHFAKLSSALALELCDNAFRWREGDREEMYRKKAIKLMTAYNVKVQKHNKHWWLKSKPLMSVEESYNRLLNSVPYAMDADPWENCSYHILNKNWMLWEDVEQLKNACHEDVDHFISGELMVFLNNKQAPFKSNSAK